MRKNSKIISFFIYTICICLCIFYAVTLYMAVHPDVSHEYTNYYITKSGRKWAGHTAYSYALGTPIKFMATDEDTYHHMGVGWSHLEEGHCWSNGAYSELYFTDLPEKDLTLKIKAALCISDQYSCLVSVNGIEIGQLDAATIMEDRFCTLEIPEEAIDNGYVQIRFDHINAASTEADSRLLGIAVQEVCIDG